MLSSFLYMNYLYYLHNVVLHHIINNLYDLSRVHDHFFNFASFLNNLHLHSQKHLVEQKEKSPSVLPKRLFSFHLFLL